MRLLVRTIAIIGITLTILVVLLLISSRLILLESFAALEQSDARAQVMRATNAVDAELDLIASYVSDWAPWDASYEFVQGKYENYPDEFLVGPAFENIGTNLMLFTDTTGAPLHWMYYNLVDAVEEPVPDQVLPALLAASTLYQSVGDPSATSGLVGVGSRLVMVASHPIVHNDFSGPIAGYLVFARFVDQAVLDVIEERVQLSVQIHAPAGGDVPVNFVQAMTVSEEPLPVAIDTSDTEYLVGYALLRDLNGAPVAIIGTRLQRDIYAQGLATQRFLFVSTLLLALTFGAVVAILLTVMIVRPVSRMIGDSRRIAGGNNPAYRLRASGTGELADLVQSINIMLDRLYEAQAQIKQSEARNRALIEAVPDTLIRIDAEGNILDYKASTETLSIDVHNVLGTRLSESFGIFGIDMPTSTRNKQLEAVVTSLYRGQTRVVEFQAYRDGVVHDFEFRVVGFGDEIREALILLRDITDRKQAEHAERSILLLKEVHHRVKNNLQVISSLLSLQARQVEDPAVQALFRNSQTRVMSMALIHEKLYGSQQLDAVDFGEYVRQLSHMLFVTYDTGRDEVDLEVTADSVLLPVDKAVPFGLVVNELVSNALKHAFPDGQTGTVRVAMKRTGDTIRLEVRDSGVGLKGSLEEVSVGSLGMQLVLSLVQQLGGVFHHENDNGSVFQVEIAA